MSVEVIERAEEEVRSSPWPERAGRLGLCARGVIYCVVALVAVRVATGDGTGSIDKEGALEAVAHQPLGKVLLLALAVGFAGYAVWRFAKALLGAGEGSRPANGHRGWVRRAGDVGRGLVYLGLLGTAVRFLVSGDPSGGGGGDDTAREWSARLMEHTGGRWLVIAIGAGLVVTGVVLLVRALAQKFEKHLRMQDLSPWQRTWLPRVGTFGYAARGVVAALVGVFVGQAGRTFDAGDAVGIDGALKRLAHRAYGPGLLVAVAFGLAAFGVYSFVEARWRKVLEG
jgi:hypothetical protein